MGTIKKLRCIKEVRSVLRDVIFTEGKEYLVIFEKKETYDVVSNVNVRHTYSKTDNEDEYLSYKRWFELVE